MVTTKLRSNRRPAETTTSGEVVRQRLLAGLPIAERWLQLNGVRKLAEIC